jgi:hypothetical protein
MPANKANLNKIAIKQFIPKSEIQFPPRLHKQLQHMWYKHNRSSVQHSEDKELGGEEDNLY